jgi:CBS domain-containing protein
MVPANKVLTCWPEDTVETALRLMLDNNVGSVVVLQGSKPVPVGIVTKTDLLKCYLLDKPAKQLQVQAIMSTSIETVLDTSPRDAAATHFENTKHRHAFVVNQDSQFVGLVSAYDIAVECARDDRAWPWNRDGLAETYKVPPTLPTTTSPKSPKSPKSPTSTTTKTPHDEPPHTFLDIGGATER